SRWRRAEPRREGAAESARAARPRVSGAQWPRSSHHPTVRLIVFTRATEARAASTAHQSNDSFFSTVPPGSRCAFAFRGQHFERLLFAEIDEIFGSRVIERLEVGEQLRNPLWSEAPQGLRRGLA